jgi:hypothetical protein
MFTVERTSAGVEQPSIASAGRRCVSLFAPKPAFDMPMFNHRMQSKTADGATRPSINCFDFSVSD